MAILLASVKNLKKINHAVPKDFKREHIMDELKTLNVLVARSGKPINELSYTELKQELAIAYVLNVDIDSPSNKFY